MRYEITRCSATTTTAAVPAQPRLYCPLSLPCQFRVETMAKILGVQPKAFSKKILSESLNADDVTSLKGAPLIVFADFPTEFSWEDNKLSVCIVKTGGLLVYNTAIFLDFLNRVRTSPEPLSAPKDLALEIQNGFFKSSGNFPVRLWGEILAEKPEIPEQVAKIRQAFATDSTRFPVLKELLDRLVVNFRARLEEILVNLVRVVPIAIQKKFHEPASDACNVLFQELESSIRDNIQHYLVEEVVVMLYCLPNILYPMDATSKRIFNELLPELASYLEIPNNVQLYDLKAPAAVAKVRGGAASASASAPATPQTAVTVQHDSSRRRSSSGDQSLRPVLLVPEERPRDFGLNLDPQQSLRSVSECLFAAVAAQAAALPSNERMGYMRDMFAAARTVDTGGVYANTTLAVPARDSSVRRGIFAVAGEGSGSSSSRASSTSSAGSAPPSGRPPSGFLPKPSSSSAPARLENEVARPPSP